MLTLARKLWRRSRSLISSEGFFFDRPIVLFHSDDWGRVGLRDKEGLQELQAAGLQIGEHPYDCYGLETADDLAALSDLLKCHRDSAGRPACLGMNFVVANLDFAKMRASGYRKVELLALTDGLPDGWKRPSLFEAYRGGIGAGVFFPALHGTTHFCRRAVERHVADPGERGTLLRTLWQAGTPYIHWRMPWIGYEYWDPEMAESERFLSAETQAQAIGAAAAMFAKLFSKLPRSACAPGYRANTYTHQAWVQCGVHVAQNGPGMRTPPHLDDLDLLHLYRNVEFEPAVNPFLSLEACVQTAEECFSLGIPAVVSVHSINFHSSVKDYRSTTLKLLDQFLTALETRHSGLLYFRDDDLYELVTTGTYNSVLATPCVNVRKRRFIPASMTRVSED